MISRLEKLFFALLKRLLSSLVVIIAFRQIILSAFIMTTQSVFGIKAVMADAAPHSISMGLEMGGEGQVFRSMTGVKYFKMRSAGVSRTNAAATVGREVLEGWYGHWDEIPSFFLKKSIWAWQDDCCAFYYFRYNRLRGGGVAKEKIDLLCEYGSHISLVMYFVVMLLAFGFAFSAALGRKSYGFGHLFCALVLVGFFMLLAISESAMRYKVVIMPYVFIYAACTLKIFLENRASRED